MFSLLLSKMSAQYEQFYFVTWAQSQIVKCNQFREKLKAVVPEGTQFYGGQQVPCVDPNVDPCEAKLVNYNVLLVFPFLKRSERQSEEARKWVCSSNVKRSLMMIIQQKNPETGVEEDVRDTEHIFVSVPRRESHGIYRNLPGFFENAQAYIEVNAGKLLFGDRMDLQKVEVERCVKVSVLGLTHVRVMC